MKTEEDKKEIRRDKQSTYDYNHRAKIAERQQTKDVCEVCGAVYSRGNKSHHTPTKKHQLALLKLTMR